MVIIRNPQNSVGSYFGPYLRVQGVGLYGLGFGLCGLEFRAYSSINFSFGAEYPGPKQVNLFNYGRFISTPKG